MVGFRLKKKTAALSATAPKLNFAFSVAKRLHRLRLVQHLVILIFILGMKLFILLTVGLDIPSVRVHIEAFDITVALDYVERYVGAVSGDSLKTGKTFYEGYTALYRTMTALQTVYVAFPDLFAHDLDHVS